ncbi:MAG: hypothetical protein JWO82_2872 [Akkermansiaceae bacterium]|nr:hypothetical protein [Akkermansiaceae bacterium]
MAGCELSGSFSRNRLNPADLQLTVNFKSPDSSGPSGMVSMYSQKAIRERFGDLFDDLLKNSP